MLKQEIIKQYDGFGNKRPQTRGEHFRSVGFSRSANGMSATRYQSQYYKSSDLVGVFPQFSTLGSIYAFAFGKGRDLTTVTGSTQDHSYFLTTNGYIMSQVSGVATPLLKYPANVDRTHFANTPTGLIADQKNRLLYVGDRYLGMFDPLVADATMTVSVTNGSVGVTKTAGTSFDAGMVNKMMRIVSGSTYYYHRINTYSSATNVNLHSLITLPTGSYTAYVLSSWDDRWKDFGTSVTGVVPTETYEDTVLFGRGNNITTLNITTDTITTDASPAFNLPSGFSIEHIHKGSNGILIGCNFQTKGVVMLWDNFSDRSIAPWIDLPDQLVSVSKYGGNWILITTREIYLTNGYSLTSIKKEFLNSELSSIGITMIPQSSVVIEDDLYFPMNYTGQGKRRAGLYKMSLTSKLFEYYPRTDRDQYNLRNHSIFYVVNLGRLYTGCTNSLDIVTSSSNPTIAVFITNPVGEGETKKVAKQIKISLREPLSHYDVDIGKSFKIIAKIYSMKKQMIRYAQVKTTQTLANKIVVDETIFRSAVVGEEVEFLEDNNAGYSRNITAITGGGTNTATYTLDRDLPALSDASDNINITSFELIKVKSYTTTEDLEEVLFDIKNAPKGRHFMIKIEFEDLDTPIELPPISFIYDDLGII